MMGMDILEKFGWTNGPAWPVFRADMRKFFDTVDRLQAPYIHDIQPSHVTIVRSLAEATAFRERMGRTLTRDYEATGLRCTARDEILLSAAFSDGQRTMAFTVDHPAEPNPWAREFVRDTLEKADRLIAHNCGMEQSWESWVIGYPIAPDKQEDTQAAARIIHDSENLLSLADQSRIHLGVNIKALSDLDVKNLIAYPVHDVLLYNGLDAYGTHKIFEKNIGVTSDVNYRRLVDATAMVTQMQLYGLPADLAASHRLRNKWQRKADAAKEAAKQVYEVRQWELDTGKEWRISADQDTADALVRFGRVPLPKSNAGNYRTDEGLLIELAGDNPLVRCLLDHREASKIISTYIDPVVEGCARHTDGLLHPCYSTTLTATTRLSSEDPNAQNWPRRFNIEIREQVVAPPGCAMWAFDYGQLEARILAMASRDNALIEAFINGYDIHAEWGPIIQKRYPPFWDLMRDIAIETYGGEPTEKQIKKVMRDRIKNGFVFPSFYGSYPRSIALQNLHVPEPVIEDVSKMLWAKFPGVKTWMEARRKEYANTGSVTTLTKWARHGILKGNEPINTPIQGVAANVVADAMNECAAISRTERDIYMHPRIQIHDDLTFFLPEDERMDGYVQRIFKVLARRRYNWQTVPWLVEAKCGYSWADLEEVATFTGDYHK
jgi:DNA polymerase I-like protein with 3'-5' exonuclease and polymerase domains